METFNKETVDFGFVTSEKDEARLFTEIWTKVYRESKKAGFKNMFEQEEREFIQKLHLDLFGKEPAPDGIQNLANNQTFVPEE
jgi:hypothetical protein